MAAQGHRGMNEDKANRKMIENLLVDFAPLLPRKTSAGWH
jgi:hypothetical protein